jgi:riboflavin kinase/FMN adenylyltransferase
VKVFDDLATMRAHVKGPVATVGNFDGLHRGHRAIIDRVLERSREVGGESLVITFDPHPLRVVAPERAPRMLTTRRQKLALLEAAGVDFLLILPFTMELATLPAAEFVRRYLAEGLGAHEVFVGANFNFGRGREGNADLLVRLCEDLGIRAAQVEEVRTLDSPISSSRIRRALLSGEVELARELLGRPYSIEGSVVHGATRGAALGFPTANLNAQNELVPQDGVYVTETVIEADALPSVTNIGTRPTFEAGSYAVETHVLDAPGDLYGRQLEIRFLARLRQELKFVTPQALIEQIHRDVSRAREFFRHRAGEPGPIA